MPISKDEFHRGKIDDEKEEKRSLLQHEKKYIFKLAIHISLDGCVSDEHDIVDWTRRQELENTLINSLLNRHS